MKFGKTPGTFVPRHDPLPTPEERAHRMANLYLMLGMHTRSGNEMRRDWVRSLLRLDWRYYKTVKGGFMADEVYICMNCGAHYHRKGKCDQCPPRPMLRHSGTLSEEEWEDLKDIALKRLEAKA